MKKYLIKNKDFVIKEKIVSCIGYFDGIHLGHQDLIRQTISDSQKLNTKSALICFKPDPADVISGKKNKHIFSDKERINLIKSSGIDVLIIINFDETFMKIPADDFVRDYLNRMNICKLICGFDFSFGYMGKGNENLLRKYGNFSLTVIPEHKHYGKKVSSTRIREELNKGNLKLVNKLLGYPYYLNLKVINCFKKGSKWLVESIKNDKNIIDIRSGDYGNFSIKDDVYYFESDSCLKKGEIIKFHVR